MQNLEYNTNYMLPCNIDKFTKKKNSYNQQWTYIVRDGVAGSKRGVTSYNKPYYLR
jgi:hypothetical protein